MALPVPSGNVSKSSDICSKGYYLLWTLFILQLISCVSCLFEDQIGKFDWRQHYIGKLKYATFDAVSSTKRILVATEQNVLAALNPKSGQLLWRQVLEREDAGRVQFLHSGTELVSISGGPMVYIRAWDLNEGFLLWEWTLTQQLMTDAKWLVDQGKLYHVVPVDKTLEISAFSLESGTELGTRRLPASWLTTGYSCDLAGSNYACVTADSVYWANVLDAEDWSNGSLDKLEIVQTSPQLHALGGPAVTLKTSGGEQVVLSLGSSDATTVVRASQDASLLATNSESEFILLRTEPVAKGSSLQLTVLALDTGVEHLDLSATMVLTSELQGSHQTIEAAMCSNKGCRILLLGEDHSISLVQHPGKVLWTREEALASILSVEMLDLPVSDTDAAIEKEFGNKEEELWAATGFFGMLSRRVVSQVLQLQNLFMTVLGLGDSLSTSQRGGLVRDGFGLHKMIVAVSAAGKVFGIDNLSGEVLWQQRIENISPFTTSRPNKETLPLYVLRTTSHVPYPAQCAVLGQDKLSGKGVVVVFNPMTGHLISLDRLGYSIQQAIQLPHFDEEFVRGLILLDNDQHVHPYPPSSLEAALKVAPSTYIFTADAKTGLLLGYSLALSTAKELLATRVWELQIPASNERLSIVATKSPAERVHSQGRVLADRNVLYKYLNPNLVALITQGFDPLHKYFLNVYLLDSVSGSVVFSASHKRAKGPVHAIHSENWLVYSFYNDKSRRTEVATLELYEGRAQTNTTAFSSLYTPMQPIVERQAFIMPAVIESMRETITEKGITSKHILMALSGGGILELPWMFVDPRRPTVATAEMRDEGVIPYIPELPIPADAIINYNQSVVRVRGIHTAPSGLESTCLVLAYGLDLFYTRVAPSKSFDLLKDDFDYLMISAVLLGLIVASYFTKKLASRKVLRQAWK